MHSGRCFIVSFLLTVLGFLSGCATDQQQEAGPVGGTGFYYERNAGSESQSEDTENSRDDNYEDDSGIYAQQQAEAGQGSDPGEYYGDSGQAGDQFDNELNFADIDGQNKPQTDDLLGQNNSYQQPQALNDPQSEYAPYPAEQGNQAVQEEISGESDEELVPVKNTLWWLGFDYREEEKKINVEMITLGSPVYELLQEHNQFDQPELVIRFKDTGIRPRLKRPVDASEFLSPVAFMRTRYRESDHTTDVVITLRDEVKPELFSEEGNILLSFAIPEKYQGNFELGAESVDQAQLLASQDISPMILEGSVQPREPAFREEPAKPDEVEQAPKPEDTETYGEEVLPENPSMEQNQFEGFDQYGETNEFTEGKKSEAEGNEYNQDNENNYNGNNAYDEDSNNNENNEGDENEYNENNQEEGDGEYDNQGDQEAFHDFEVKDFRFSMVAQDGDNQYYSNEEGEQQGGNTGNQQSQSEDNDSFNDTGSNQFDNAGGGGNDYYDLDENLAEDLFNNQINENLANDPSGKQNQAVEENVVDLSGEETVGSEEATDETKSQMQPVSMVFKGATLKEVIRTFSLENGINFIFPENIGNQKVFLNFTNVPWDEALQAILETHSLGLTKLPGNVVRIDSLKTLDQEKQDLEKVRESASHIIPTKVLVVRLSYAKAENIAKVVKTMLESQTHDKRTKVEADTRTNSVIVEAIPSVLSKIKALLTRVDLQTPQVKVDTRIVEVTNSDTLNLGINWAMPMRTDQSRGLGFGNLTFPNQITSAFSVDTGTNPASLTQRGAVDLHFGSINNLYELDVRLRMAEVQQRVKSLQNNSVVVLDNEKAETKVGDVVYLSVPAGDGKDQLSNVEYYLLLMVTPHITADGAIQMEIEIEHSSATPNQTKAIPDKQVRKIQTKLLRENGQTAVIGGIYKTEYSKVQNGIPFFSGLPLIGALFRNTTWSESKRELIVLVTPTVINSAKSLSETGTVGNSTLADNFGQVSALNEEGFNAMNEGGGNDNFGNSGNNYGQNSGGGQQAAGGNNFGGDFFNNSQGTQGSDQAGEAQGEGEYGDESYDEASEPAGQNQGEQDQQYGQEE